MARTTSEPDASPTFTRPNTRRDRMPAQRWAEGALADHPYRLELRGGLDELTWPGLCAHCGGPAGERVAVSKAFRPRPRRRSGSGGWMRPYRIATAPVPFCGGCAAEHRALVDSPSLARKLGTVLLNPLMIPVAGSIWGMSVTVPQARGTSLAEPAGLIGWGLVALFAAIALWSLFLAWQTTRAARLDPQTHVTLACDFSEDVSQFYERERRIYALRNEAFARALADANAERLWSEEDQARSKSMSFVVAVATLVVLAGVAGAIALAGR